MAESEEPKKNVINAVKVGGPAAIGIGAGAVLLGPAGAVVGGIVGLGIGLFTKKKTEGK